MRVELSPTQNPPRETDVTRRRLGRRASEDFEGIGSNVVVQPHERANERPISNERTNERTNEMAEGLPREEVERMLFFEDARARAEAEHKQNPKDAQVLTRWGGALLELAHFRQGPEAVDMIEEAVQKFELALAINPKKHDALWCLGNALTSQGFLFPDANEAMKYFEEAKSCFRRALDEEPNNEIYRKALEMTDKAPGLHAELQRQLAEQAAQQQTFAGAPGGVGGGMGGDKPDGGDDFYWQVAGWVTFAAIATSWLVMANMQNAH